MEKLKLRPQNVKKQNVKKQNVKKQNGTEQQQTLRMHPVQALQFDLSLHQGQVRGLQKARVEEEEEVGVNAVLVPAHLLLPILSNQRNAAIVSTCMAEIALLPLLHVLPDLGLPQDLLQTTVQRRQKSRKSDKRKKAKRKSDKRKSDKRKSDKRKNVKRKNVKRRSVKKRNVKRKRSENDNQL